MDRGGGRSLVQPGAVRGLALGHRFLPLGMLLGRQMGDLDVDRLHLLELGRDEAEPVADLVAGQGHVLAFDVRNVHEDVVASVGGRDEAVSFAPAERPHFSLLDGVTHGPVRCGSGSGAPGDDRRRKLQMGRARRNAGHRLRRRRDARRGLVIGRYLDVAGHDGDGVDTGQGGCYLRTNILTYLSIADYQLTQNGIFYRFPPRGQFALN